MLKREPVESARVLNSFCCESKLVDGKEGFDTLLVKPVDIAFALFDFGSIKILEMRKLESDFYLRKKNFFSHFFNQFENLFE